MRLKPAATVLRLAPPSYAGVRCHKQSASQRAAQRGGAPHLGADVALAAHGAQRLHQHGRVAVDAHPHAVHEDLCRLRAHGQRPFMSLCKHPTYKPQAVLPSQFHATYDRNLSAVAEPLLCTCSMTFLQTILPNLQSISASSTSCNNHHNLWGTVVMLAECPTLLPETPLQRTTIAIDSQLTYTVRRNSGREAKRSHTSRMTLGLISSRFSVDHSSRNSSTGADAHPTLM